MAGTWGGCRCPERAHRDLFVPISSSSLLKLQHPGCWVFLGGDFSPLWYLLGSAAPKPALGRFFPGTRMLERGRDTPVPLSAAPGQSRPPSLLPRAKTCLCASRAEGKKYPKASGFLVINPAHNIIDFTVLPTLTIL